MVDEGIIKMWTEKEMNEYAKVLELNETLVLRAFYDEKLKSLSEIESWVLKHLEADYDRDYVESIFTLMSYPDRVVPLQD
jgi:hypothetical protein